MTGHRKFFFLRASLVPFAAILLAGCGSSGIDVKGKATTADGKPVKGGSLVFSPVATGDNANPGKSSTAEIQQDGTFKIAKAHPGKNRVIFTQPPQVLTDKQKTDPKYVAPPAAYTGYTVKDAEVELKADTEVTIEIVKK